MLYWILTNAPENDASTAVAEDQTSWSKQYWHNGRMTRLVRRCDESVLLNAYNGAWSVNGNLIRRHRDRSSGSSSGSSCCDWRWRSVNGYA